MKMHRFLRLVRAFLFLTAVGLVGGGCSPTRFSFEHQLRGLPDSGGLKGGSTAGNPTRKLYVEAESYIENVEMRLCLRDITLGTPTNANALIPVGALRSLAPSIQQIPTPLGAGNVTPANYSSAYLNLADQCGTGYSAQVRNAFGTFNTQLALNMRFTGAAPLDSSSLSTMSLAFEEIVGVLQTAQTQAEVEAGLMRSGDIALK